MIKHIDIADNQIGTTANLCKKVDEIIDSVNKMLYWHENLPRFWQNLSQEENSVDDKEIEIQALRNKIRCALENLKALNTNIESTPPTTIKNCLWHIITVLQ